MVSMHLILPKRHIMTVSKFTILLEHILFLTLFWRIFLCGSAYSNIPVFLSFSLSLYSPAVIKKRISISLWIHFIPLMPALVLQWMLKIRRRTFIPQKGFSPFFDLSVFPWLTFYYRTPSEGVNPICDFQFNRIHVYALISIRVQGWAHPRTHDNRHTYTHTQTHQPTDAHTQNRRLPRRDGCSKQILQATSLTE